MSSFFLTLSISRQIQLGIAIVILICILLFQLLIVVALFIQLEYLVNFFNSLIEKEENSLMRNYNLMLENYEYLTIENSKKESMFLHQFSKYITNDVFVTDFSSANCPSIHVIPSTHSCSDIDYNRNIYSKKQDNKGDNIMCLMDSVLKNMLLTSTPDLDKSFLFKSFQFYVKGNSNRDENFYFYSYEKKCSLENQLVDFFLSITNFNELINKKIDESEKVITNTMKQLNFNFKVPTNLGQFSEINNNNPIVLFDYDEKNTHTHFVDVSRRINSIPTSTFAFDYTLNKDDSRPIDLNYLSDSFTFMLSLDWVDNSIQGSLINIIDEISNALFLITGKNNSLSYIHTPDFCHRFLKYGDLSDKNYVKALGPSNNINNCFNFSIDDKDLTSKLNNLTNETELGVDYQIYIDGGIDYEEEKYKDPNSRYMFKISKLNFPRNSSNLLISSKSAYNVKFENFVLLNNNEKEKQKLVIFNTCFKYFIIIVVINYIIWVVLLVYIFIRVFFISRKISRPIDDLIQSVSQNNDKKNSNDINGNNENKINVKEQLQKISYKDDNNINELFELCKKLIIGGFKQFAEKQKKKMKLINGTEKKMITKSENRINEKKKTNYFEQVDEEDKDDKSLISEHRKSISINRSKNKGDKNDEKLRIDMGDSQKKGKDESLNNLVGKVFNAITLSHKISDYNHIPLYKETKEQQSYSDDQNPLEQEFNYPNEKQSNKK